MAKTTKDIAKELKEKVEKIMKEIKDVVEDDKAQGVFARIISWIKNFLKAVVARIKKLFS